MKQFRTSEGSSPNIHPGYIVVPHDSSLAKELRSGQMSKITYEAAVIECNNRIANGENSRFDIYKIYREGYVTPD